MPASTPRGYPYPLPTEPVAEGAQRIRELAEAIEAKAAEDLIATSVLAAAGAIDFAAIPALYSHLRLVIVARTTQTFSVQLGLRFNGLSGGTHNSTRMKASAAAMAVDTTANVAFGRAGELPGTDVADAAGWASAEVLIPFYRKTGYYKHWQARCYASLAAPSLTQIGGLSWDAALKDAAINRVQVISEQAQLLAGSRADLYGVK